MRILNFLIALLFVNSTTLAVELRPVDTKTWIDNSGNVTQGIAKSRVGYWITQDAGRGYILFNQLDENGKSIGNWQLNKDSHGADLSFKETDQSLVFLTDSSDKDHKGIGLYKFDKNKREMSFLKNVKLFEERVHVTPSFSFDKKHIVARSLSQKNNRDDRIYIYKSSKLLNGNINKESSFLLDFDQTQEGQWFQGIAYYNDVIFCLTGNHDVNQMKLLYQYDRSGNVISKMEIDLSKHVEKKRGYLYELEGLTIVNGSIYTVLNEGKKGKRKKSLFYLL